MTVNGNHGSALNYEPNSFGGPAARPEYAIHQYKIEGLVGRHKPSHPNDDFVQAGNL